MPNWRKIFSGTKVFVRPEKPSPTWRSVGKKCHLWVAILFHITHLSLRCHILVFLYYASNKSGRSLKCRFLTPEEPHHEKMGEKWPPFWRRPGPTAPQRRAMISTSTPLKGADQKHQDDSLVWEVFMHKHVNNYRHWCDLRSHMQHKHKNGWYNSYRSSRSSYCRHVACQS